MKSKSNKDDEPVSPIALIQQLRTISRSQQWQQESILDQLELEFKRLTVSTGNIRSNRDTSPMIKDTTPAPSAPSSISANPFKPGVRVLIQRGVHKGHHGVIISRNKRKGGTYWDIQLDNPSNGKSVVFKIESHLVA